jgi:hypothetical protein
VKVAVNLRQNSTSSLRKYPPFHGVLSFWCVIDRKTAQGQDGRMEEEGTGIAIVTEVTRQRVVEVDEGAEVGFFTVRAKMYEPEHKYSADLFLVKILEPPGMGSLQNEEGSLMRHGEFGFEALQEVNIGDKLKIFIRPAAS